MKKIFQLFVIAFVQISVLNAQNLTHVTTIANGQCSIGGVTSDDQGNVYFGERSGCYTLKKVDPTGVISLYSTLDGDPAAIKFDANGYLYVAYHWSVNNKIVRIPPGGGAPEDYVTGLLDPFGAWDIIFDGDTMYFGEYASQRIYKVLPGGGAVGSANVIPIQNVNLGIEPGGNRLFGVEWSPSGNFYVIVGSFLYEVDKVTGVPTYIMNAPIDFVGLARTSNNDYYFTLWTHNYIYHLDVNTLTFTQFAGTGSSGGTDGPVNSATFNMPHELNPDNYGNLIIGEYGSGKVRRIWGCNSITSNATAGQACVGDMIELNSSPVGGNYTDYNIQWTVNGNVISSNHNVSIELTPNLQNSYAHLTITDILGCSQTDSVQLVALPSPTASAASVSPSICINTAIPSIEHTTTFATGIGNATGLPPGVTASFSSDMIIISGTPTTGGTFNYIIPLVGGCAGASATGTIIVLFDNNVSNPSSTPTVCANVAITAITHTTTGASGIGTPNGLPTGLTASFNNNTITISGTPTASGVFNYNIPLTGGCGTASATGTITVNAANTVGNPSATPTLCVNTALMDITHATTGAFGIGSPTGLPAGVSASFANNIITINGTPTASGTFNYIIPLSGGCGNLSASGTITVTASNTASAPSSTPVVCINTPIPAITHSTTGAIGIGTATGLPAGVTASFASNTITLSGTPTAGGTFNYNIPLTGGCGNAAASGTITVECLGVDNIENQGFRLFPNPNNGQFTLESLKPGNYDLIDITGKIMRTYQVNHTSFNIHENLPAGLYFMREKATATTMKFIVQ